MRIPIHQLIKDHQPLAKIQKEIKEINAVDEKGFTPLQLAARLGRVDVVLWLLSQEVGIENAGNIGKTSLCLAMEYDQVFLARILLAYGANKGIALGIVEEEKVRNKISELEISPLVVYAQLFRAIKNGEESLFDSLIMHLTDVELTSSLIEFSFHIKRPAFAIRLLQMSQEKYQSNKSRYTALYWKIIKSPDTIYLAALNSTESLVLTFKQLRSSHQNQAFDRFVKDHNVDEKVFAELNGLQDESEEKYSQGEEYSRKERLIYESAARGDLTDSEIKHCCNEKEYYQCVKLSFAKKNYVALNELFNKTDPKTFLKKLLENADLALAYYWLTLADINVFELALEWQKDERVFSNLIQLCFSVQGLLHNLVSRGIIFENPIKPEIQELFKATSRKCSLDQTLKIFQMSLQDRYQFDFDHFDVIHAIRRSTKPDEEKETAPLVRINKSIDNQQYDLLAEMCVRFGIRIEKRNAENDVLNLLTRDIWGIVYSYFEDRDCEKLRGEPYWFQTALNSRSDEIKRENRLMQLGRELKDLNRFNDVVRNDIEAKSWFAERVPSELRSEVCGNFTLLTLGINGIASLIALSQQPSYPYANEGLVSYLIMAGAIGFMAVCYLICNPNTHFYADLVNICNLGNERFRPLPLNRFSERVRGQANRLFNLFSTYEYEQNPLVGLSAASPLRTVENAVSRAINSHQQEQIRLIENKSEAEAKALEQKSLQQKSRDSHFQESESATASHQDSKSASSLDVSIEISETPAEVELSKSIRPASYSCVSHGMTQL